MGAGRWGGIVAAPFLITTLCVIAYAISSLIVDPPGSWTLVLTVIAGVAISSGLMIPLGHGSNFPTVGVSIAMLAIEPLDGEPFLGVCIWTVGILVSQIVRTRSLLTSLVVTGLAAVSAFAFVAIQDPFRHFDAWLLPLFLVATTAYYLVFLTGQWIFEWLRTDMPAFPSLRSLNAPRFGLVILGVALTATAMNYVDRLLIPWLDNEAASRRSPFVVLLAASMIYLFVQRARYSASEDRLSALVDAAIELPRETGDDLSLALQSRARFIVKADEVSIRDLPPEDEEIGARLTLVPGREQYLIASRGVAGSLFSREDERALNSVAHVASEAARTQDEVLLLERRANTDALTGLPNYGAFQKALVEANENRLYHEGIALLFIDLDDFKKLNDNHGHRVGDELLRAVRTRLETAAGGGDFVSRVGGDEFVIILTGLVSIEQAKDSADRIVEAVGAPLTIDGEAMRPVVSAGLAFSNHRELDARTLVEDADRTMLRAKRSRREGDPTTPTGVSVSSHRSTRTNDIVARAIEENRLGLAFQPIVKIDESRIWAFEALVRYVDPELGPISPPSLVARAKSLGLMNELTMQVITKALDAAEEFRKLESGIACITVNLELGQICEDELGPFILESAAAHPDLTLCIELNERSLRTVTDDLRRDLELLQSSGVIVALDDYGSDDSPVGALVHFPMNILKIDKSLISDLEDRRQREVLKALQGFSDNLDYTVIVEGIETAEMVDVMVGLGMGSAQGYFYGRPLPFLQTMDRLRRWSTRAVID